MEEKLKDVYENIKDRLSNPLIFSFISSWLICNWRISIALIRYDKSQFSGCGCQTIFDYIEFTYNKYGNTWLPVIIAICYTLLIPFIKNGIRIISAQAQKWGEEKEIKILDGGKIGIDKYLKLREEYKDRTKKLEDVAKEEREYLEENGKLLLEINEVKSDMNVLVNEKNKLTESINKISDYTFLDGQWKYYVKNPFDEIFDVNEEKKFSDIFISNRRVYPINSEGIKGDDEFFIDEFFYDKNNNKVFFIKKRINNEYDEDYSFGHRYLINILFLNNGSINFLNGKENGKDVEYQRVPN